MLYFLKLWMDFTRCCKAQLISFSLSFIPFSSYLHSPSHSFYIYCWMLFFPHIFLLLFFRGISRRFISWSYEWISRAVARLSQHVESTDDEMWRKQQRVTWSGRSYGIPPIFFFFLFFFFMSLIFIRSFSLSFLCFLSLFSFFYFIQHVESTDDEML